VCPSSVSRSGIGIMVTEHGDKELSFISKHVEKNQFTFWGLCFLNSKLEAGWDRLSLSFYPMF
jgi:hypothetical protein